LKRKFRLSALAFAGIMMLTLFAGCAKNENEGGQGQNAAGTDENFVMKIDGEPIYYDEYRYFFIRDKYMLDQGDDSVWENEGYKDILKKRVENDVKVYRASQLVGDDLGIKMTNEEIAAVDAQIKAAIESLGGEEQYKQQLEQNDLTEELYKKLLTAQTFQNKIYNALYGENGSDTVSDKDAEEQYRGNYVRVKHILIKADASDLEEKRKEATAILERARSGEDFQSLVDEYGEDPGMAANPDGYYFTINEMVKEFEDASFALKVDEISDLVQTVHGFHIIKRLEITDEYIKENLDNIKSNIYEQKFSDLIMSKFDKITVEYGDIYDSLSIDNVKSMAANDAE